MLNKKTNILTSIIVYGCYAAILVLLTRICYDLFGWMIINYNGNYRSDIPAYIRILEDRPGSCTRLIYVIFRTCRNITGSDKGINIFLAVVPALICLSNLAFLRYLSNYRRFSVMRVSEMLFLSVAIIFIGPIYVPKIHEYFYMETFPSFAWHSPTQITMTLFSVLATLFMLKMFDGYKEKLDIKWWLYWLAAAVFFFLSAYTKPSYVLDVAPAIVIAFIIELLVRDNLGFAVKFRRLFLMGLSLVPSGLYILMLYTHVYTSHQDEENKSEVVISFFNSTGPKTFIIFLICSFLLPLIVLAFNLTKIISDKNYRLMWLVFIMGILQWGVFSESGWRSSHGNFTWGCVIGGYMIILMSVGVAFVNFTDDKYLADKKWLKVLYRLLFLGALCLHLGSNLYYFYTMYGGAGYWR